MSNSLIVVISERLVTGADTGMPQEVPQGILDRCRRCGIEIIRKARTRPKICKECEKKQSKSVEDKCMVCERQISHENVRRARRCVDCKEKERKLKKEVKKIQKTVEELHESYKFQPSDSNEIISHRVYTTNNRIRFLQESQQVALMLCQHGYQLPACFREDGLYCEMADTVLPSFSHLPKFNTEWFNSPEEIVEQILLIRSQFGTVKQINIKNEDDDDDRILVPLHIQVHKNLPITTSRIEVEILDENDSTLHSLKKENF